MHRSNSIPHTLPEVYINMLACKADSYTNCGCALTRSDNKGISVWDAMTAGETIGIAIFLDVWHTDNTERHRVQHNSYRR